MNTAADDLATEVQQRGYAVARNVLAAQDRSHFEFLCAQSNLQNQARRRGTSFYGIRHMLTAVPELKEILSKGPIIALARRVLGNGARPVKGAFFDKTSEANWPVPWHQDVTITVRERRHVPGFEMRPVKEGLVHVLPPVEVSEQLLALRIHLDDAGPDHGALRVIPGSHRNGRLDAEAIREWMATTPAEVVSVQAGDVMLMRPLLLHASSPCVHPEHRRVIHVEFAAVDLPGGLEWAG